MKSPVAKKLLFAVIGLVVLYVLAVVAFSLVSTWGGCTGGRAPMMSVPSDYRPATCAHIPDVLGVVASELILSVFSFVMLSPIWITVAALLVALPEISERQRLKREKE